jgi:hypothetical protein
LRGLQSSELWAVIDRPYIGESQSFTVSDVPRRKWTHFPRIVFLLSGSDNDGNETSRCC